MKKLLLIACCFQFSIFSYAHPGIGIVQDSQGNIYYTDLKQVWKIRRDGSKTIVVHSVHTHELYIDAADNLYGEHLWYNGEQLNTWGSYAWCLHKNGKFDTVVGPKEGFLEEYSFVRDSLGNQYWVERFTVSRIKKKTPEGKIITLAEKKFKDIRWMHVTPDGNLYFVDLLDLYHIDVNGVLSLMVKGLAERPSFFSLASARHSIFGIWLDRFNNVYVAVSSERTVKKITPDGKVTDIAYSLTPWSPCGGLFDAEGNLWLMEFSITNETRVRKITASVLQRGPAKLTAVAVNQVLPFTLAACALALGALGVKKLLKKKGDPYQNRLHS